MARRKGSRGVVLAALAGNIGVSACKFTAFAFTGSTAMLTEGVHSLVDTGDQLLLLVGQRRAERAPDRGHPFGYGLETYFWSFVVALLIFLAGGVVSIREGLHRLAAPAPLERAWLSFLVLGASALFEGISFAMAYREYRRMVAGSDIGVLGFLRLSKDPSVFGTLLEDGAALMGLALAAIGIAASTWLQLPWADGAASVAIGALLVAVALFMANEIRSLIAGEAAAPPIEDRLRAAATAAATPLRLTDFATLQLGPQAILVVASVAADPNLPFAETSACCGRMQAACRSADARVRDLVLRLVGTASERA